MHLRAEMPTRDMQKVVLNIQGLEFPAIVRFEDKGFMECETVTAIEVPGGITIHPGALLRAPIGQVATSRKAWFTSKPVSPELQSR